MNLILFPATLMTSFIVVRLGAPVQRADHPESDNRERAVCRHVLRLCAQIRGGDTVELQVLRIEAGEVEVDKRRRALETASQRELHECAVLERLSRFRIEG